MKFVQFKKAGYGLSLFIGSALVSIVAFPLGAYAAAAPAPKISATPASVNFPPFKVGETFSKPVIIKNTGSADLVVGAITFTGTDTSQFSQTNDCSTPLSKNVFCTVTVTFAPTVPYVKKSAALNIASNDLNKPVATVKLSGQAPPPVVSASPMSVNLTAAGLGIPSAAATVTIKNTGVSDLNISSVTITGPDASLFTASEIPETLLPKGESSSVNVFYTPDNTGTRSASLEIASDDPKKSLVSVKLTGKTSTTYSKADLAGTWTISSLDTGAGAQKWVQYSLNIADNGSFTGTSVDSGGNNKTTSGTFIMSATGQITQQGEPNMLCQMDAGKTVAACTDTPDTGVAKMGVFTKKGESYALTDLSGTWNGNFVAAGVGTNSWTRVGFAIATDGSFTGTSLDSNGIIVASSGIFSITPDGVLTWPGESNLQCSMDAAKTVLACTDTPKLGNVAMAIFTKNESYTLADLAGTWAGNGLATGPSAPWWVRATFAIKPDGTYTVKKTFNNGAPQTGSGTLQLLAGGVMKLDASNDMLCQVDPNKTVIGCTKTLGDGSTELFVITRKLK